MKIKDLKLFITVVELGSFTAAANALDLPRANVSRRINELEKVLNTRLFFRTTRQLSLTQHGEKYHAELLTALQAFDRANDAALQVSGTPKGKVKVGLLPESDESLQPLLFSFQDLYPDIELDIRSINNGFSEMYQQGLDVVIHGGKLYDTNIIARKVLELERHLIASPEYIKNNPQLTRIEDLYNHPCICFRWPNGELDNCWGVDGHEVEVKTNLSSNNIGFVKRAVLHHRGIGFLPSILIKNELENGHLVKLLPELASKKEPVWLLYPERKSLTQATQLLIDFLLQELPKINILS